ncbi:peptidase S1 [Vulcanimicrobium alpinum]|uniref:Peptidase S1 n=1 Tax=Vulcanimicrobium alpinum TaxID=3016050 RepID=A0AAN1XTR2_UNVUL|nr:trypsin-like peptidase domain-containing protein [Vulcanimicrobium alpinum]BDE05461.1 peptidase S1 [Vulcanimicrobium alpinum]
MKSRSVFGTAVVGLIGAIIGSFSMMLYASTHFAGVAGPGNTPPAVSAAPLQAGAGTTDQDRIVNAVKRVQPSVVALEVVVNGTQLVPVDPFAQMFGGGGPVVRQRVRQRASGSGFVYSKDGLILTNAHVVPNGTSQITVVFNNGDKVKGHVFSSNPGVDLALVKVDGYAKLPPPLEFVDTSKVSAGQWAIAIGEPLELQHSVAVGVVSGFNRDEPIQGEDQQLRIFKGLLQTSAPINPGNSGGPLIDYEGRVIGVNQSTANPSSAQGIGFAIPSTTVMQTAATLAKNPGKTLDANGTGTGKAFLGVQVVTIDNNVRTQLGGYRDPGGVAIGSVVDGTAAAQAGLEPGDVIQAVNGKSVNTAPEFTSTISSMKPGTKVTLRVWSSGVKKNVDVTLGEQPVANYLQQQQSP